MSTDFDVFTFYQINSKLLTLLVTGCLVYVIFALIDYGFYFFHKFIKKDLDISVVQVKYNWRNLK